MRAAISCTPGARGGPAVRGDQYIAPWAGFGGDQRRVITPYLFVNYFKGDAGHSTSFSASPEIDLRVSSQFRGSVSLNLSHNINDTQDLSPTTDVAGTHYRFAHL